MIRFHQVTKAAGRKAHQRIVLHEIDWTIPQRSRFVILSVHSADGTVLLDVISGAQQPTSGWVERRATVSTSSGHLRSALPGTTPRQLIAKLARIYEVDELELAFFVERFADFHDVMGVPLRFLTRSLRHKLSLALFYGIPCDFYLFDGRVIIGAPELRKRCQEAFARRCSEAGAILVTTHATTAREFGGVAGVLHQGHLYIADDVEDAIAAREQLARDHPEAGLRNLRTTNPGDFVESDPELF